MHREPLRVLIRATSTASTDNQSHLSISAECFDWAAFLADRKVAKFVVFEEQAAATFPCLKSCSKPKIPTSYSAESQERVLINLAMVPFLRRGATCCLSLFLPLPSQTLWNGALFNSWLRWICTQISRDRTALMRSIFHLITAKLEWSGFRLQLLSTCTAAQQSHTDPGDKRCPTARFESWLWQKPWDMSCAGCRTRTASGTGKRSLSCKQCSWFVRDRHSAKMGDCKTCSPVLGWKEL